MNTLKISTLSSQFYLQKCPTKDLPNSTKHPSAYPAILLSLPSQKVAYNARKSKLMLQTLGSESSKPSFKKCSSSSSSSSRFLIMGAVSVGVMVLLMGMEEQKAVALGPEGPLMEEFWDNVRRYGLYALTVSTGALYAVFLPIYELLKNPISAVLVLVILAGGIFILSQVVTAMVGVSDFTYDYGY